MSRIDVKVVRDDVVAYLKELGFQARDADITDLQHGLDSSLRFKVGTSMGEVAVLVIKHGKQAKAMRIVAMKHVIEVKRELYDLIQSHWKNNPARIPTQDLGGLT